VANQQSVYANVGFTSGNYFLGRFSQLLKGKDGEKYVDIINMVIEKALIAKNACPQFMRVAAELIGPPKRLLSDTTVSI
jgi:hypothetical protein